jgi:hypothetical protein
VEAAPPTEALAEACQHAAALAWQAGQVQQECGLDILPDEFARGALRFGLVEARPARGLEPPHGRLCMQSPASPHGGLRRVKAFT